MLNYHLINYKTYIKLTDGINQPKSLFNSSLQETNLTFPISIYSPDLSGNASLIYDSFSIFENDSKFLEISGIPKVCTWDIGFLTYNEAELFCDTASELISGTAYLIPIKHPNRNEWATINLNTIFDLIPSGTTQKSYVNDILSTKQLSGLNKTKQEMQLDGWF